MTVEAIAEAIGKTARGVKTMLTRRGLTAADYDGAAKAAKQLSNFFDVGGWLFRGPAFSVRGND